MFVSSSGYKEKVLLSAAASRHCLGFVIATIIDGF